MTSKPVVFPLHASALPETIRNALILRELIMHGTWIEYNFMLFCSRRIFYYPAVALCLHLLSRRGNYLHYQATPLLPYNFDAVGKTLFSFLLAPYELLSSKAVKVCNQMASYYSLFKFLCSNASSGHQQIVTYENVLSHLQYFQMSLSHLLFHSCS